MEENKRKLIGIGDDDLELTIIFPDEMTADDVRERELGNLPECHTPKELIAELALIKVKRMLNPGAYRGRILVDGELRILSQ